jgi:hypothetical protein
MVSPIFPLAVLTVTTSSAREVLGHAKVRWSTCILGTEENEFERCIERLGLRTKHVYRIDGGSVPHKIRVYTVPAECIVLN